MESWIFQYSLGEQQLPGLFRFNLPQMIRQQYQYWRVNPDHFASGTEVTDEMVSPSPLPTPVFSKNDKVRVHLTILQINAVF
jgi:hypothetical protein